MRNFREGVDENNGKDVDAAYAGLQLNVKRGTATCASATGMTAPLSRVYRLSAMSLILLFSLSSLNT